MKCSAVRTGKNHKRLAGQQRVYRCRNEATRIMRIHQHPEHARVAESGWFEVALCETCFFASDARAIVMLKGRQSWRRASGRSET